MTMEVGFNRVRLAKLCTDPVTRRRRLGEERAKKVLQRLNQMDAAPSLADLIALPQARCHQLAADRDEQFTVDLDGPYRLAFVVADNPVPRRQDGGIALDKVQRVTVTEIIDPH
jgi:proteic killer suppression protein